MAQASTARSQLTGILGLEGRHTFRHAAYFLVRGHCGCVVNIPNRVEAGRIPRIADQREQGSRPC